MRDEIGESKWSAVHEDVCRERGYLDGVKQKNSLLIAGMVEELAAQVAASNVLDQLCGKILEFADGANG